MQRKQRPLIWETYKKEEMVLQSNMSGPSGTVRPHQEEMQSKEMEFPVPADGVIPLNIKVMDETEVLTIDVR